MSRHDHDPRRSYDDRFDELAQLAYRVGYRLTGHRQEAEDLAQEALTRAYLRWRKVEPYAEAWVVRVTTNLAIGRWRRARPPAHGVGGPGAHAPPDDRTADRLALVAALRALPRRQREVAVLRFVGDLSIEATAAALGCSSGSVKQHSARALAALRRAVEPTDGAVADTTTTPTAPAVQLHAPEVTAPVRRSRPERNPDVR